MDKEQIAKIMGYDMYGHLPAGHQMRKLEDRMEELVADLYHNIEVLSGEICHEQEYDNHKTVDEVVEAAVALGQVHRKWRSFGIRKEMDEHMEIKRSRES